MLNRIASVLSRSNRVKRFFSTTNVRKSGDDPPTIYRYRLPPAPAPERNVIAAEVLGGIMWWWILWHLFTEPDLITGEYDIPDPTKWTDQELGVPPDDED